MVHIKVNQGQKIFIEFLIFQINKTILHQLSQKPYQKLNYIIKKISTTVMLRIVIPIVAVALLQPKREPE